MSKKDLLKKIENQGLQIVELQEDNKRLKKRTDQVATAYKNPTISTEIG